MKNIILATFFFIFTPSATGQHNFNLLQGDNTIYLVDTAKKKSYSLEIENFEVLDDHKIAVVEKKDKKGIVDLRFGKISCCDFDNVEAVNYFKFYLLYKKGNERGIATVDTLDGSVKYIISGKYDNIYNVADVCFELKKGKKFYLHLSTIDQIILKSKKSHSLDFFGEFFTAYSGGKYTLFRLNGEKLLESKFNTVDFGSPDGSAILLSQGLKKNAVFNAVSKKFLVNPIKGMINTALILDKYFEVYSDEIKTLVDIRTAKPILSLNYKINPGPFQERYFIIEKNGKFGIYDSAENKIAVDCKYSDEASALSDKLLDKK